MKIRFSALAWQWGIDDLTTIALPSLLQRDNIPWLLENGVDVTFTLYTIRADAEPLEALVRRAAPSLDVALEILDFGFETEAEGTKLFKRHWYVTECRRAIAERCVALPIAADLFYGNGSVRNLAVYCKKPGVVPGMLYLRVKRDAFFALLEQYRDKFGDAPISNAKLVDMALRSQLDALAASNVDTDTNAAETTGIAVREIGEGLYAMTHHFPTPAMFWPQESDMLFFDTFGGGEFESHDHLWPLQLIAEDRWRYLASSDLFFLVEVVPEAVEAAGHSYASQPGRLYDDSYRYVLPHTLRHEAIVATLRREDYLA